MQHYAMPLIHGREAIPTSEAARRAGVSAQTIRRWIVVGWIDAIRTAGRGYLIYADSLTRDIPKRAGYPQPGAPSLDNPLPPAA